MNKLNEAIALLNVRVHRNPQDIDLAKIVDMLVDVAAELDMPAQSVQKPIPSDKK